MIEWSLLTVVILVAIYFFVKMIYYSSINLKEQRSNEMMKMTLTEAEVMIRKYQVQLQRSLGNVDILTDELNKMRAEVKSLKARNSKYRIENEKLVTQIKELEDRIAALL